jgi:hypothetical protein
MWGEGEGRADPFIGPAAFSGPAGENDCRPGRRATRYFPLPFRPNTLVSPRARRGCNLVWNNIAQIKPMVETVV